MVLNSQIRRCFSASFLFSLDSASVTAFFDDSDDCSKSFRKPYSLIPCGDSSLAAVFRSRLFESSKARPQLDLFSSDDDEINAF
ncbi:hypothetical protein L1887_28432 [Cichorium endivia]|nr:hypothetical protein L1887_28432 [Cichorium endivia]